MAIAVKLREDFSAAALRRFAAGTKNVNQSRRLLSLAAVQDGMNRTEAARIGGMDRQTLRDWVDRFNECGPDGLKDTWTRGNPPRLSADQQHELAALLEAGPDRAVDGVVLWRRTDLQRVIEEALRRRLPRTHGRQCGQGARLLPHPRARSIPSRTSGRSRRSKNFAELLSAHTAHLPKCTPVKIWFQDEARIGQKNGSCVIGRDGEHGHASGPTSATRAPTCSEPSARRAESAQRSPATGHHRIHAGAPRQHCRNRRQRRSRRAAADRAGWHTTANLDVAENLPLIFLPSRAPELNPVENIWQHLRANKLSSCGFDTSNAIIEAACEAWNWLIDQPETNTSIGLCKWAPIGQL